MQAFESKSFLTSSPAGTRRPALKRASFAAMAAGIAALALAAAAQPAAAQDVVIGAYNDWKAHSYQEPEGKVCNMWSRPIKSEPSNVRRGDIYAFITHRPALKSWSAVSFQMGYPLKTDEEVSLQIGNQKFRLIVEGEAAFADEADDDKIAAAMRRGNRMVVRGVSTRGTRHHRHLFPVRRHRRDQGVEQSLPQIGPGTSWISQVSQGVFHSLLVLGLSLPPRCVTMIPHHKGYYHAFDSIHSYKRITLGGFEHRARREHRQDMRAGRRQHQPMPDPGRVFHHHGL